MTSWLMTSWRRDVTSCNIATTVRSCVLILGFRIFNQISNRTHRSWDIDIYVMTMSWRHDDVIKLQRRDDSQSVRIDSRNQNPQSELEYDAWEPRNWAFSDDVKTTFRKSVIASWRHVTTSRILSICWAPRLFCLYKNLGALTSKLWEEMRGQL